MYVSYKGSKGGTQHHQYLHIFNISIQNKLKGAKSNEQGKQWTAPNHCYSHTSSTGPSAPRQKPQHATPANTPSDAPYTPLWFLAEISFWCVCFCDLSSLAWRGQALAVEIRCCNKAAHIRHRSTDKKTEASNSEVATALMMPDIQT
jgi:hypothetical protein